MPRPNHSQTGKPCANKIVRDQPTPICLLSSSNYLLISTVKPVLSGHSKRRPKIGFQDQLSFNAGQKYCRMLQGEHSAILLTCIKISFVIKIFVLSIFERPFYTGFTVLARILPAKFGQNPVGSLGDVP